MRPKCKWCGKAISATRAAIAETRGQVPTYCSNRCRGNANTAATRARKRIVGPTGIDPKTGDRVENAITLVDHGDGMAHHEFESVTKKASLAKPASKASAPKTSKVKKRKP